MPVRHRHVLLGLSEAIPNVLNELQPLRWRQFEDLLQEWRGIHEWKLCETLPVSKCLAAGVTSG